MSQSPAKRADSYSSSAKAEQTMIETSKQPMELISEFDESVVIAEGEEKVNAYTWYLLGVGALSGLLFGYDTGVISAALVNIGTDIGGKALTSVQKEWVTSSTSVGALLGAWFGGWFMDRGQIITGRLILGMGVGIGAGVCAVYLGELSPTLQRGRVVGLQSICITGGQLVSYAIGAGMTFHNGWRYLFALSIPPALFQAVALHFLPESPRYSLLKGDREAAKKTLHVVYAKASDEVIERKLDIMLATVQIGQAFEQKYPSVLGRLRAIATNGLYRRPVIVSGLLFLACQLGGVNSLMYYSATLFQYAGLKNPTAISISVAATNLTATLVGAVFLDKYGRRRTYLTGAPIAIIALCMAAMCFHFLTLSTGGKLDASAGVVYPQNWVIGMIVCIIIYLLGFGPSLGTIPYTTIELLPLEIRSVGTAISISCQWVGNIILSSTFLSIMDKTGPSGSFGIYAVIIFIALVFAYFCYPEPSGLSMEETSELFLEGFGVKKANAMRKARQAVVKANRGEKA
ncbi:general substrate transporter [Pseudohyphozyma bogoriensis]|nr:general substrate transporter [Pseudohyphozyma bogoriensis]